MVRELFELARTKKACIIFFDEIDAIGGARFDDGIGGDNEVQRTMLELINQLDGFDPRGNIKVLMATNRPDTLDPALTRPGALLEVAFGSKTSVQCSTFVLLCYSYTYRSSGPEGGVRAAGPRGSHAHLQDPHAQHVGGEGHAIRAARASLSQLYRRRDQVSVVFACVTALRKLLLFLIFILFF